MTRHRRPGSDADVTYACDNFGRVTEARQLDGATIARTLAYAYDALSRLVSETQPLGAVSYEYDAAGRRTRLTYPGSLEIVAQGSTQTTGHDGIYTD